MMRSPKKILTALVLLAVLLALGSFGLAGTARAADVRAGTVVIRSDEVIDDDLVATGDRIRIDGTVRGDLIAAGQEIVINGTVEGSTMMAGQTLFVNGDVNGSIYAAGYSVTVAEGGSVGRNVFFAGFSADVQQGASVGRGLYFSGYQAILDGDIGSDVFFSGGALSINGSVGGDIEGEITESTGAPDPGPFMPQFPGAVPIIPSGLDIGPDASIEGSENLRVVRAADVQVRTPEAQPWWWLFERFSRRIGEFITLMIVGILLLLLWPILVQGASDEAESNPLPSTGWGCLTTIIVVIGVPFVGVLILLLALIGGLLTFGQLGSDVLRIGGASLGLVVVLFGFTVSTITKVVMTYLVGRLILSRLAPRDEPGIWNHIAYLALGAFLYEIVRFVPLLGWLTSVVITLIGLGALFLLFRGMFRPQPPAEPLPVEAAEEPG